MILAVIVIAGGIGFGYIWKNYGFTPSAQEAPALSKKTTEQILLDGKVVSEKKADLGFILPEKIKIISKKVGDVVKTGDILATQESADLQAEVSAAQASLLGAKAELNKVGHDLKKEELKLHGLSSYERKQQQAQISSNKDSVIVQQSAVDLALSATVGASAQLEKTILRAPFDGIITRQDGEIGEVAGASVPAFMTILSKEPLRKIEAFASELDVAKIIVGEKAKVVFDVLGSQKTMLATVSVIDPTVIDNQGKSAYRITLMLDEADEAIKPGMHASVAF